MHVPEGSQQASLDWSAQQYAEVFLLHQGIAICDQGLDHREFRLTPTPRWRIHRWVFLPITTNQGAQLFSESQIDLWKHVTIAQQHRRWEGATRFMSNAGELSAGYLCRTQSSFNRKYLPLVREVKIQLPAANKERTDCFQVHSTIPNEKVIERITRLLLLVKKSGSIDHLDSHTQVLIPWRRGATPSP